MIGKYHCTFTKNVVASNATTFLSYIFANYNTALFIIDDAKCTLCKAIVRCKVLSVAEISACQTRWFNKPALEQIKFSHYWSISNFC